MHCIVAVYMIFYLNVQDDNDKV